LSPKQKSLPKETYNYTMKTCLKDCRTTPVLGFAIEKVID